MFESKWCIALLLAAHAAVCRADVPAEPGPPASRRETRAGIAETWEGARWGMSPTEIVAALPGGRAYRLEPPVTLQNGRVAAVGIDGFPFHGLELEVRFIFERERLVLVSLRTPKRLQPDGAAYETLAKDLTAEWGAPLERTADDRMVDQRQTRWNLGSDRADLKYIPGVLVLIFYPRPTGR